MNKKTRKLLDISAVITLLALAPLAGRAQSLAYSNAIESLNPVAYWPMHETNAPAPGDIETNLGTLGNLANGYYNDWSPGNLTAPAQIYRQYAGPFTNAPGWPATPIDYGVEFSNSGGRIATSPYLMVPNVSTLMQLKPPFTVECWVEPNYHQIGTFSTIMGQGGGGGLNNSANYGGFSVNFNNPGGNSGAIYNMYAYDGSGSAMPSGTANASTTQLASNQWFYCVYEFTSNNTTVCVANGAANTGGQLSLPLNPAPWSPFWVANGRNANTGPAGFSFDGAISEVAIYTNALPTSDLANHYAAGTNASPTTAYTNLVLNDPNGPPIVYLRMNAPAYTAPPVGSWPPLDNYGTTTGNGVYTPGTFPGILTEGVNNGYPVNVAASQVALLSAMGTFADVGGTVSAACNPTGSNANFTVTAMFRGNPSDSRTQSIVGHGTNSWQLGLTTTGTIVFNCGNGSNTTEATGTSAGDLHTVGVYNDGNWHQVVAVATTNQISIYVDGSLDTNGAPAGTTPTSSIPGNSNDALIGADPSYTNANVGLGRQFSGQICEVAFFNGALTSSQVTSLYNTAGVSPYIKTQPLASILGIFGANTNISAAYGGSSLTYQWYFETTTNGPATALQNNGNYATVTSSKLTINSLNSGDAGYYYLVASDTFGSVTTAVTSVTVLTAPGIISQFPVTYTNILNTNYMTLYAGANPAFSVSVLGALPLAYHWFTNGVLNGTDTTNSLVLTNVQSSFANNYCIITNSLGSATSVVWSATVIADPTNSSNGLAPYPQTVLALNPIGYWRMNDTNLDGVDYEDGGNSFAGGGDFGWVCHDYVGGNDGLYTNCNLGFPGYSPTLDPSDSSALFGQADDLGSDYGDSLAFGISGINFGSPSGASAAFTVEAWVNGYAQTSDAGIVTLGYSGAEQFDLDCGSDTSPTSHGFRFFIRDASGGTHGVSSTNEPLSGTWYHLVGVVDEISSQSVTFYVDGLPVGNAGVSTGSGILSSTNLLGIGSRLGSATTNYNLQFSGNINDVAIYNYALSSSQVLNQYLSAGVAPILNQPPVAATNASGNGLLVLPAMAVGTGPMTYWWTDEHANTNIISGATNGNFLNATLTVSNVPVGWNNDQLELTVSNIYGGASALVSLSVPIMPILNVSLPPQVSIGVGQSYTYFASANGALPLSYQWSSNGLAIAGANTSTYTVTGVNPGSATYSVAVTNLYGALTNFSVLTVIPVPTNSFAASILALHPVGYWPLQETNPAAATTIETNYGTLGALGNGYYAVTTSNQTDVQFDQSGALSASGDNDSSVTFGSASGTNELFVPRLSPELTLVPPFTLEAWEYSSSTAFSDLISESGNGLNGAPGAGNWGGPRLSYSGNTSGGPSLNLYVANGDGTTRNDVGTPANSLPTGKWHHCVATYDGTNTLLYIDGSLEANDNSTLAGANTMAPDTSTPLTIGDGLWTGTAAGGQRPFAGSIDEVAIYTNILTATQVENHYLSATTAGSNYMQTIVNDKPLLYYRMDCAGYVNTAPAACPDAVNFGSAPVNATYLPGTRPGYVAGPINASGSNYVASPINGITASIDAGYYSTFNTATAQPCTALCWVKGNPGDSHLQGLVTHGVNWALDLVGATGSVIWTNAAGSVASTTIVNDGNWHFVAGVYDGVNNYVYVDGALNNYAAASGGIVADTTHNVYLGGDSDDTAVGVNEEYLGGAIAQAAFFTNALSAADLQALYTGATIPTTSLNPTNILYGVTNNQLTLTWPADHIGWQLQVQTNKLSVGISSNWANVSGSTGTNQIAFPIVPTNGAVFYRLAY